MGEAPIAHVYGAPPAELVGDCSGARQHSPLFPDAARLEAVAPASLDNLAMLAPPGAIERRYALALALRALKPGAPLVVTAPNDKGGGRLAGDLAALGCAFTETAKRRHRTCVASGPGDAAALDAAIGAGAPRLLTDLGLWSQPGVFSWDRIDPGTALLIDHLPALKGRGADLGCGLGALAHAVLASPAVAELTLIDVDGRAVDLARRNVDDSRARFLWADVRTTPLSGLDFIVSNPPFHDAGHETKALGQAFIEKASAALRSGGALWLTANRHLPYEGVLKEKFRNVTQVASENGYKIFRAQK